MSIKKVMTMFALLMGIACASYAQGVTNDSTATAKSHPGKFHGANSVCIHPTAKR